jgi:pyroglutamyl-peptidase
MSEARPVPEASGTSHVTLVTGFDAYNGAEVNPSGEIARALDGTTIGGLGVVGRVFPVSAARTPELLRGAIDEVDPEVVLMFGVWPGRAVFSIERVAVNVLDFPYPDNEGAQLVDAPVLEGGPAAYLSTVPVKAVVEAWRAAGIPGAVSETAGTYLCNQSFYAVLDHTSSRDVPVGFVHIPTVPSEASRKDPPQASLPLTTLVEGAKVALEAIAAARRAKNRAAAPTT